LGVRANCAHPHDHRSAGCAGSATSTSTRWGSCPGRTGPQTLQSTTSLAGPCRAVRMRSARCELPEEGFSRSSPGWPRTAVLPRSVGVRHAIRARSVASPGGSGAVGEENPVTDVATTSDRSEGGPAVQATEDLRPSMAAQRSFICARGLLPVRADQGIELCRRSRHGASCRRMPRV
jgi:hypothetical protein